MRTLAYTVVLGLLSLTVSGCCGLAAQAPTEPDPAPEAAGAQSEEPTLAAAADFMQRFEAERRRLLVERERADWMRSTNITHDTELLASRAEVALMELMTRATDEARRFAGLPLEGELARKMDLLRLSQVIPAPADPAHRERLAALQTEMHGAYGRGQWCPAEGQPCLSLGDLSRRMATSRDPEELKAAWAGWRTISVPLRETYTEYAELANGGAHEIGFPDTGALWRSKYDMAPDAFGAEMERLWEQVRPLYEQLHCYVRGRLAERYGAELVPDGAAIPAHLLGNMWAQEWSAIADVVIPDELRAGGEASPITKALVDGGIDPREMVRIAERFFVSLGLPTLPETFWERSMFTKPADRDVVCHASAWPVDWYEDLRIKMCIEIDESDFVTVHHELGHLYYYDAYKDLATLFTESAHDGFHEALGDTIALSVTPGYLQEIGLAPEGAPEQNEIEVLLRRALDKVAFLPFGLLVDKWRWQVFSGEVGPDGYNAAWWELKRRYQGVTPPVERSEADFDPGAKYHVAASVPYSRYFLAHVLQFQLHRGLCAAIGHQGPLHECSIYGAAAAGERLAAMMALGSSQPWPEALDLVAGERRMDGTALLDYFAPLMAWLEQQNQGRTCGW